VLLGSTVLIRNPKSDFYPGFILFFKIFTIFNCTKNAVVFIQYEKKKGTCQKVLDDLCFKIQAFLVHVDLDLYSADTAPTQI